MKTIKKLSFLFGMASLVISSVFIGVYCWSDDQVARVVGLGCLSVAALLLFTWIFPWAKLGEVMESIYKQSHATNYRPTIQRTRRSFPWMAIVSWVDEHWYPIVLATLGCLAVFYLIEGAFTFSAIKLTRGVAGCILIWLLWVHKNNKWSEVRAWIQIAGLPFVFKHWKKVWLTVSVTGLIISFFFATYWNVLAGWVLSTILAGITVAGLWEVIRSVVKKALNLEYGKGFGAMSWSMLLLATASILYAVIGPNTGIGWMFGLSIMLFWVVVALGIKSLIDKNKGGMP